MAKFHLNDKGEAGQCRADKGGCPFGGEAQHYSSPENARTAYEVSMANEQFSTVSKKPKADDRAITRNPPAREEFYPGDHDGFQYNDVFFDRKAVYTDYLDSMGVDEGDTSERAISARESAREHADRERKIWEGKARTERARSFEKDVPLRLIPNGSKVESPHTMYIGKIYETVGVPVVRDGNLSQHYWSYKNSYDTFNTGYVRSADEIDDQWAESNETAERLAKVRAEYSDAPKRNTLTAEKYVSKDWGDVALEELKFDEQGHLDRYASRGVSEEEARKGVEEARKNWVSLARTNEASSNEDGVPIRLIPTGSEVALSERDQYGVVEVGTVMAPKTYQGFDRPHGRVRRSDGTILTFVADDSLNTGYVDERKRVSPQWKTANAKAATTKEQRARVEEFERNQ